MLSKPYQYKSIIDQPTISRSNYIVCIQNNQSNQLQSRAMTELNRNITLLIFLISFSAVHPKRHYKFFKGDVKAYEPYANVTHFRIKPINRHLAVVDGEGYLKRELKNGKVRMLF